MDDTYYRRPSCSAALFEKTRTLPSSFSVDSFVNRLKQLTADERDKRKNYYSITNNQNNSNCNSLRKKKLTSGYETQFGNFTVFVDLEMAARYWGEEKEPEAIYAVYLRKVRYRAPNVLAGVTHRHYEQDKRDSIPTSSNGGPAAIGNQHRNSVTDHLQWETVKERVVKAATLKKLVQCLVSEEETSTAACSGEVDTRQFNAFFATYRAFAKPFDVLRLILVELYSILHSDETTNRPDSDDYISLKEKKDTLVGSWRNILLCWLEMYPDDFREHPKYPCLTQLIEFSRNYQTTLQDVFVQAVRRRDKFCRDLSGNKRHPSLEKCSLLSPLDGLDYLFSPRTSKSPDISHVDPVYVAEQLTYWDAELFKRLVPHQCQSCFWSRRNKEPNSSENVYTVKATIDQFNAVSRRVMASVVNQPNLKSNYRARVIGNWIEIAQELRILKNFSSLKAVLSGLQSEPVYRLRNVWALVSGDKVKEFNELSQIFSEDDNYNSARSILEKEGTAKAAIGVTSTQQNGGQKDKHQRRLYRHRRTKSEMGDIQGTVPYLGTFLTDLTMIDSAYPDTVEGGLINFEKRKREFDVIAKLRLFQSSARNYHINVDQKFRAWFIHLPNLSEQHCYQLSCLIEPPAHPNVQQQANGKVKNSKALSGTINKLFFRDLNGGSNGGNSTSASPDDPDDGSFYFYGGSVASQPPPSSSTATTPTNGQYGNSVFYEPAQFSANHLWNQWFNNNGAPGGLMRNGRMAAVCNGENGGGIGGAMVLAGNGMLTTNGYHHQKSRDSSSIEAASSHNNSSSSTSDIFGFYGGLPSTTPPTTPISKMAAMQLQRAGSTTVDEAAADFYVVRVALERSLQSDITMTTMYKCVKLDNNDRTYHLIEKVIQKHQIIGDPSDYWMVQLLPDGDELVLPEKGNAFYAVSPCTDMNFELRRKTAQTPTTLRIKKNKRKKSRERSNLLRWSSGFL